MSVVGAAAGLIACASLISMSISDSVPVLTSEAMMGLSYTANAVSTDIAAGSANNVGSAMEVEVLGRVCVGMTEMDLR